MTVLGTVVQFDPDAIVVVRRKDHKQIRIQRSTITRLEVKKGHSRGRNALIGAGIAAGIGLVWATIEYSHCRPGEIFPGIEFDLCGLEFGIPIVAAPVGALVGLAFPGNERWVEAAPPRLTVSPRAAGARVAWSFRF